MKENKDISLVDLLISKYLSGNCNAGEFTQLSDWLKAEEDNRTYFIQQKALWLNANAELAVPDEKKWEQLKYKLTRQSVVEPTKKHIGSSQINKSYRIFRYAATIALIVAIPMAIYFYTNIQGNNDQLTKNELIVPYGSKSILTLPDGTKLWVNSGSKLTYQSDFGKNNRNIYLTGEAYFNVAKNKKLPFIVHTGTVCIRAIGTSFNVKAYPEENKIETTLVQGLVEIDRKGLSEPIHLKPKQKVVIMQPAKTSTSGKSEAIVNQKKHNEKSPSSEVSDIVLTAVINTEKETCWTEGKLIFEKEPLELLAVMLSRRYNVHFTFKDKAIQKYLFTGTFNELTLEQILKAIRLSSPIDYQLKEKEVIITDK